MAVCRSIVSCRHWLVLAGLCAGLSACASDFRTEQLYADPAKYTLYDCEQLARARPALLDRDAELRGLMARARQGEGGESVARIAYRAEYLSVQGDLLEMDKKAASRNCSPWPPAVKLKRR